MKITIEVNCVMKTKYKEYQYKILRKCGDTIYYFDENDKWCSAMTEFKIKKDIPMEALGAFNQTKFKVAIAKLEVGDEYETFKKLYKLEEKKGSNAKGLDRFIGKIKIYIERETDNANLGTFDFIKVFAFTTYNPECGKREYIKQNIKEINSYIFELKEKSNLEN